MHLVTGAAGFIGGNLIRELNRRGVGEILAADDLADGRKFVNLRDCEIADYMDWEELHRRLGQGGSLPEIKAVLHQGACADTMASDGRRILEQNFEFSKRLLQYALVRNVPFVYASSAAVYGGNPDTAPVPGNERPLNLYGWSKLIFDQYVRRLLEAAKSTIVGLRYFNVYGPGEVHKDRMASMPYQMYRQLRDTATAQLFRGTDGYADGEQRRDFVHVDHVVAANLFFIERPLVHGIFNVGMGTPRTFNETAGILIKLLGKGQVEYIPFPEHLRGKYQNHTRADLSTLRNAGFTTIAETLEDGLAKAVEAWAKEQA